MSGNVVPVQYLAELLQVAFDAGAKRLLLPMASVQDTPPCPANYSPKYKPAPKTSFYADPADAVFKALRVM